MIPVPYISLKRKKRVSEVKGIKIKTGISKIKFG